MASLEQEGTLAPISEEGGESSPRSHVPCAVRVPAEEWTKMSRNQRRNFLRRRSESRGGTPSFSGEAAGGEKRPRDVAGFTPSPGAEARKRPKTEAPKYSHMLSCLKVAIVHKDHPKEGLTEDQGNGLASKLVELLRENGPEEGLLTFCGFTFRTGALVINCADEKSRDWLRTSISKLSPWEGLQLKTCDPKELEGYIRIATFVPNPVTGVEAALGNIRVQNGLNTAQWRILPGGVKMQPKGLFLAASIPESQFKRIEGKQSRLACGLHLIEVKRLKEKTVAKEEERRRREGVRRVEDKGAVGVAGEAAAGEPIAMGRADPLPSGSDMRMKVSRQVSVGEGEPTVAGGQQDAAPGSPTDGGAVGMNLGLPGELGSGPPPS